MRNYELGGLLSLTFAASPARVCRRRPHFARNHSPALSPFRRALLLLSFSILAPQRAAAVDLCAVDSIGWCIARRISGDAVAGELGFRFGEPLDANGDGKADIAAGARFKLQQGTLQNGNATVYSGADGSKIRSWDGEMPDALFGHSVTLVPDLGGDGLADLFVSSPIARFDDVMRGVVVALSPSSGYLLWTRSGDTDENFGWDLALAGDQNGVARTDLFVGAPATADGRVYLLSGKDGSTLRVFAPKDPEPTFGWYVARLSDLDGDKRDDLAVGAQLEMGEVATMAGGAHAFSSATGKELFQWRGRDTFSGFGEVVAALSDVDGDGKGEIVVAAPRTNDRAHNRPGDVFVFSGTDGRIIRHFEGLQPGEIYGRMIAPAGDIDDDGVEDLAVGAPWHRVGDAERVGRLELRSGKTGAVVAQLFGDEAEAWFGWHVRRAPDPDGRSRPTLLVASLRRSVRGYPQVGVLDLIVLATGAPPAPEPPAVAEPKAADEPRRVDGPPRADKPRGLPGPPRAKAP